MKSLTALMQHVLIDLGTRCGTSTTRDLKTITSRIEHEGLSFLTISLSNFGTELQKALDQGYVDPNQFAGYKRTGRLPRFLGGFLDLVFDRSTGRLLDEPNVDAIWALRQFTLMWAKINLECSPRRIQKAIDKYIECEQEVRLSDLRLISSEAYRLEDFKRVGRMLWSNMLSAIDSRIYNEALLPKHGPGATADKLRGNAKYDQRTWTRRLENLFPHWENVAPNEHPSTLEWTDRVTILEPWQEIAVKVITVPKTLKTPRIIAVEPTCMQYMQQGVLSVMVQEITRSDYARNFVMFESQEPNQWLAREGSLTGALATLDLSEASDRVSNQHVRLLVADHRYLREAVDATRSRKADVPGYGVQRLAKYASMGSALCFPFEALVFATVVFVGIERALNRPLTHGDIKSLRGRVRVYGDDIIVPTDYVQSVVRELEAFGFRVNRDKSFWTGKFRESCGKDYYDGHDVSVAKVRSLLPVNRRQTEEIASTVSLRNQLYWLGLERAVGYLDARIRKLIPFPVVEETSSLLGRHSTFGCQPERFDNDRHIPLVKGVVVSPQPQASPLDGYGALMKWFLVREHSREATAFADKNHLQFAGRPRTVRIKTRWACPY